jgi:arginyl-tRNA synthetase
MIEEKIQSEIEIVVQSCFPVSKISTKDIEVVRPDGQEHGDFSSNIAFRLARKVKKAPKEIAETLSISFPKDLFDKVEAANGFLNFYLAKEHYYHVVEDILRKKEQYADLDILKGKKVQVEFISANPTGPFTLANGRGGFSGDVLANVFKKAGADVQREYYVNDGGNQVKILGISILAASGFAEKADELYQGEYISDWAKDNKDIVVDYKDNPFGLGQIAASWILENYNKPSTKNIGIHFDNWFSENEMVERGEVDAAIKKFTEFGHTYEKEGALWMKTTDFGDEKDRVLVKSDGEKTYFANDVAYHFDKLYKRKFDLVVNFWGADHHGYVARLLAAASAMGCPGKVRIVIFQLVKLIKDGKEYRMSKRKGNFVTMDSLLELIGGSTRDASDVARFFFLMRSFNTHMDFDLDLAKERSEKNPVVYVKYAYARIYSILAKVKELNSPSLLRHPESSEGTRTRNLDSSCGKNDGGKADLSLLVAPQEIELIDQMSQLPQLVASIISFDEYPVHYLTFYAIELAKKFHVFYDKCRVIDENNLELTAARLNLVRATQIVLGIVMRDLIGIDTPERM